MRHISRKIEKIIDSCEFFIRSTVGRGIRQNGRTQRKLHIAPLNAANATKNSFSSFEGISIVARMNKSELLHQCQMIEMV